MRIDRAEQNNSKEGRRMESSGQQKEEAHSKNVEGVGEQGDICVRNIVSSFATTFSKHMYYNLYDQLQLILQQLPNYMIRCT